MAGLPAGLDPSASVPVIHVQTNGDTAVPNVESGEPFAHVGSYFSPARTFLDFVVLSLSNQRQQARIHLTQ